MTSTLPRVKTLELLGCIPLVPIVRLIGHATSAGQVTMQHGCFPSAHSTAEAERRAAKEGAESQGARTASH